MDRPPLAPWVAHFDRTSGTTRRNRAEAADHVRRLRAAIAMRPGLRLLDFGCGPGLVGAALAPAVGRYVFWDAAPTVMQEATRRLTGVAGAEPAPADLDALPAGSIDVVLVNSVVQYMDATGLAAWLPRWRRLLAGSGCLLLSDVPPPDEGVLRALRDVLTFAARERLLLDALPGTCRALMRYAAQRSRAPLFCPDPAELARLGAAAGLVARRLPENLTFRAGRGAFALEPTGASPGRS